MGSRPPVIQGGRGNSKSWALRAEKNLQQKKKKKKESELFFFVPKSAQSLIQGTCETCALPSKRNRLGCNVEQLGPDQNILRGTKWNVSRQKKG